MQAQENRNGPLVLGLDPGSLHTGFGLVAGRGERLELLAHGRWSLPPGEQLAARLARLSAEVDGLLERFSPTVAALESPFHGRNSRSLIVLAQARGALLATLARRSVEVREFTPAEVKSAVTGNGRAAKDQVARMVRLLLRLEGRASRDATDALAVAICYAQRYRMDRLRQAVMREPK